MIVFEKSDYCIESNSVTIEVNGVKASFSAMELGGYRPNGVFFFSPSFGVQEFLSSVGICLVEFRMKCLSEFSFTLEQFKCMVDVNSIFQCFDEDFLKDRALENALK